MELVEAVAICEAEAQEYLRNKGVTVDEKTTDDTMNSQLKVVKTEKGMWFDTYKRELIDLKNQVEWVREVSSCEVMKKIVWNEEIFPGVGCVDIPVGESAVGGDWTTVVKLKREIYAYFDTCDSTEIIRSEQLGLDCDGEVLIAGGQCLMTQEEEDKYYPNLDLLLKLCYRANAGRYECEYNSEGFGASENCNYDLRKNPNMKTYNRATLQEIKVMVNDFNIKLLGIHRFIDVDTGEEGEYRGYGWKETRKLPAGWHKKLNVEKNKYYYWSENVYDISGEKAVVVSTWENPLNKENKISPSPHFSDAQYNSILQRKGRRVSFMGLR